MYLYSNEQETEPVMSQNEDLEEIIRKNKETVSSKTSKVTPK